MKAPSQSKKKNKITVAASPRGLEKAEKALIRLGFGSKTNFAKSKLISRSTVTEELINSYCLNRSVWTVTCSPQQ